MSDLTHKPITKEEARTLLLTEHNLAVGDDDPILMAVTLHAAFLGDLSAILSQYEASQNATFKASVSEVVTSVSKAAEELRDALLDGAVRSVLNGVAQQSETFGVIKSKARSFLIAMGILTALQWAAVIIFFFILK